MSDESIRNDEATLRVHYTQTLYVAKKTIGQQTIMHKTRSEGTELT